jgi:hypothetical protein
MTHVTLVLSGPDYFLSLRALSATRRATYDCTVVVRVATDPDLEVLLGSLLSHPRTQTNTLNGELLGDLYSASVAAPGTLDLLLGEGELVLGI